MDYLGKSVRMLVGGRMMTTWLSDWDESSQSYNGFAVTVGKSLDVAKNPGNVNGIEFRPVRGARPYPYTERPDYSFQFVEVGEDEAPLLAIGQANADKGSDEVVEEAAPPIPGNEQAPGQQQEGGEERWRDPRDYDADGQITKEEKQRFKRERIENQRG